MVLVWLVLRDDLPGTLATHWSGTTADGFTDATAFFAATLAVCGLAAIGAIVAAARTTADAGLWIPAAALVAWIVAATYIASAVVTTAAEAPADAVLGWWIVLPLAGLVWGALAFASLPRSRTARPSGLVPRLDPPLHAGEHAVWIEHARSRVALGAALVVTASAVVAALFGQWWLAALFVVVAVLGGALASVTVRVDRDGLTVSSWGVPWRRIPARDISRAEVVDIVPAQWGGWGYRTTPHGTVVVLRSGPAIMARRTGKRPFGVTIDDADDGAALLNAYVRLAS
ncbi:hypothetical protein DW322_13465 [Rhodococcus rhodnii]|nr:hypothetical protein DW322_13465 [Rhodococcus rhodnii]